MLCVFDWSSKTRNDVPRILSSQSVSAMRCYHGTIFNATSLQIVSLKIVQCGITFTRSRHAFRISSFCFQMEREAVINMEEVSESGPNQLVVQPMVAPVITTNFFTSVSNSIPSVATIGQA